MKVGWKYGARGFSDKLPNSILWRKGFQPKRQELWRQNTVAMCLDKWNGERKYNKVTLQVQNGSFTPIVFSSNVEMGKESNQCYSQIATTLAEKRDEPYSVILYCIRSGSWSFKHEQKKHKIEELLSYSEAWCNMMWLIKEKLWTI